MSHDLEPVIIGVGEVANRSKRVEDAREPLHLMLEAINAAFDDAGLSLNAVRSHVDSLDVIRTWTWPYKDLPSLLASKLGLVSGRRYESPDGGNQPGKLLDEACQRLARGDSTMCLLTGGEALASLSAAMASGQGPPKHWTPVDRQMKSVFSPTSGTELKGPGASHGIGAPIQVYPLFENGFRAHRRQSLADNNRESADLYAEFADVAARNPTSWTYGQSPKTAQDIGTPSNRNRMICLPYPLLMNAYNTVNIAAALLVTTRKHALSLGVPANKLVYVLGAAGTKDSENFWERPNFHSSPAISRSIDAALLSAGCHAAQMDLFDIYSCFPIVPKLASDHLGLPIVRSPKPVTLTGGLTAFGGAGNNYAAHSVANVVRALRAGRGQKGLVLANGGVITYQHAVVLSKTRRQDGGSYPPRATLPPIVKDVPCPPIVDEANGLATIETYTVEYSRDNKPAKAFVVGRLEANGARFVANEADAATLLQLCSQDREPIGRLGTVRHGGGRNLFTLQVEAKL